MIDVLSAAARRVIIGRGPVPQVADADWNALAGAAERHGVAVILARALQLESLPVAKSLTAITRQQTRHSLILVRQLHQIVSALGASDIETLPVKGPVLSAQLFGNPELRGASGDLDFVVKRADLDKAIDVLAGMGYHRAEPSLDEHDHEQWESEAHLLPRMPGTLVELHTDLIGSFHTAGLDLEGVLARTSERQMFGTTIRIPAPEDLLLYLALHASRHLWRRLLWTCDVAALIHSTPELDWTRVIANARAIDARRRLAVSLRLASEYAGVTVPSAVSRSLAGQRIESLLAVARSQIAATTRGDEVRVNIPAELKVRETFRQRAVYLRKLLAPTARDRAWLMLPRWLAPLGYVTRALRLIIRFGFSSRADPPQGR